MKRYFLFLFFTSCFLSAQNFELGKVTIEELKSTSSAKEPNAAAEVLFAKGHASVDYNNGLELTYTVQKRIKIYKKEGYDQADVSVPFYVGESVRVSDAVTYNLENGQVVKTKLKKENELIEKVSKYVSRKKFTFPAVREGSIIEYEYVYTTSEFVSIPNWSFQDEIPVNFSQFTLVTPRELIYTPNFKGFVAPEITRETITRFTDPYDKVVFMLKDVPALLEEQYVDNIDNYTSSVQYEMSDVNFPGYTTEKYHLTWGSLLKSIAKHEDFGGELKKKGYFEEELAPVIADRLAPKDKIDAILAFVKGKMKWNEETGIFCDNGVKKAYKDKIGNISEINLMLTAMLRHAGLDAAPVLVSTRDNGVAFFPSRGTFDYVLASVKEGETFILLDASDEFSSPGVLPFRTLNWQGYRLRDDGAYQVIDVIPSTFSRENISMTASLSADGALQGQLRHMMTDQWAHRFREDHKNEKEDRYLERLEKEMSGIEISNYSSDAADVSKPASEGYDFRKTAAAEKIGDKLYVSPLFFLTMDESPFKSETRSYPVNFGFPFEKRMILSVNLPEGYAVESVPPNVSMVADEELGVFKFAVSNQGNKLQIMVTTTMSKPFIIAEHYGILKTFFQSMIDKEKEKIILKKA